MDAPWSLIKSKSVFGSSRQCQEPTLSVFTHRAPVSAMQTWVRVSPRIFDLHPLPAEPARLRKLCQGRGIGSALPKSVTLISRALSEPRLFFVKSSPLTLTHIGVVPAGKVPLLS
jgi:hypothetical protein